MTDSTHSNDAQTGPAGSEPEKPSQPQTIEELHEMVHLRLCECENLLHDQFETVATPIVRGGQPCGRQYILNGPRLVRLTAVWAADRNEVMLYDAVGQRYEKIVLKRRIAA